jgi:hypothetical protein
MKASWCVTALILLLSALTVLAGDVPLRDARIFPDVHRQSLPGKAPATVVASDDAKGGEFKSQSPFASGPQVSVEALRKENIELKATVDQLSRRLESIECRLAQMETPRIQLKTDEKFRDLMPGCLQIPNEVERRLKFDPPLPQPEQIFNFLLGVGLR